MSEPIELPSRCPSCFDELIYVGTGNVPKLRIATAIEGNELPVQLKLLCETCQTPFAIMEPD